LLLQLATVCPPSPWPDGRALGDLATQGRHLDALLLYREALRSPSAPDPFFAFPILLKSSAALRLPSAAAQLHARAVRSGCHAHPFILTSLISAYSRLSLPALAARLLRDLGARAADATLTVGYNALISGFALNALHRPAVSLFLRMRRAAVPFNSVTMLALLPCCPRLPRHSFLSGAALHACNVKAGTDVDPSVANCLLTMYARCGAVDIARRMFDGMLPEKRDLITWNAMVSAYAQNGMASEALDLYHEMKRAGVEPDAVTLVGVLSSCANLGAQAVGQQVEHRISGEPSFRSNMALQNALINMNGRCGDLRHAREIFDGMPKRSVVSWTAIISAYGMHGHGNMATDLFERMCAAGVQPDRVVMVTVLSACSHAGMTEKGLHYFRNMERAYNVAPGPEHYACVVDLLGRAGRLQEARELIQSMPMEPDGAVWGALLGACKIHHDIRTAELAFDRVVEFEPMNVGYYVLLSNVYSDAGMLNGVARIRVMMRQRGLRKEPGCSYMEHKGKVHMFLADDRSHLQTGDIYRLLGELEALVDGSYGGGMERRKDVRHHSEKLAIAFGLLNTEMGSKMVVIKNLRVCENCHRFIKLVSGVVGREIVVRDATRFHHFSDGGCSCNDYW
ncbi:hypothetical protein Taro_046277, partial [Colocasia esculenta]|nr:hypothetical protein [Colocasia esculenta]